MGVGISCKLSPKEGDNLHEMAKPIFWEKNRKIFVDLSAAELAQRVVNVNSFFEARQDCSVISFYDSAMWFLHWYMYIPRSMLGINLNRRHIEVFSYFSQKIGFDISCRLSLYEAICMK